jgi:hypothetical protein
VHHNLWVFELNVHLNRALLSFVLGYLFSSLFSGRTGINEYIVDVSLDVYPPHDILIDLCDFDKLFHL